MHHRDSATGIAAFHAACCMQRVHDQQVQGVKHISIATHADLRAATSATLVCMSLCLLMAHDRQMQGIIMTVPLILLLSMQHVACSELMTSKCQASSMTALHTMLTWSAATTAKPSHASNVLAGHSGQAHSMLIMTVLLILLLFRQQSWPCDSA